MKHTYVDIKPEEEHSTKPESASFCGILGAIIVNLLLMPFLLVPLWASFITVQPREEVLVLLFGKLVAVLRNPGVYWIPFGGRKTFRISTSTRTYEIKKTTVVDQNGNPIIVSGIVTYKIVDSVRSAFDVSNLEGYIGKQALAILKKVCSRYPYESKDGHSLQTESEHVSDEMVAILQQRAVIGGAKILGFELTDLQYAPEIAQGMLVRQQAQALLSARQVVVDGAVSVVTSAVNNLALSGVKLGERDQAKLVANLLAVICSDSKVTPTISIADTSDSFESGVGQDILKTLQIMSAQLNKK